MKVEDDAPKIPKGKVCPKCKSKDFQILFCYGHNTKPHYEIRCMDCEYREKLKVKKIKWFSEDEIRKALEESVDFSNPKFLDRIKDFEKRLGI